MSFSVPSVSTTSGGTPVSDITELAILKEVFPMPSSARGSGRRSSQRKKSTMMRSMVMKVLPLKTLVKMLPLTMLVKMARRKSDS